MRLFVLLFILNSNLIFSQKILNLNALDTSTQNICGVEVILDAGVFNKHYVWSTGDTSQTITINTNGLYFVNIYDSLSSSFDSILVKFHEYPVSYLKDTSSCKSVVLIPDLTQLTTWTKRFLWSTGDTLPLLNVHYTGSYWVKIYDLYCEFYDTVNYINLSSDAGISTYNNKICEGDYLLNAGEGVSYLWSTGETTQIITIDTPGTYQVKIINLHGCEKNSSVTINYTEIEPDFINIPNVFTPNGDGVNDSFNIIISSNVDTAVYSLSVYDRWGKLVWETKDPKHKWSGEIKKGANYDTNNHATDGVYYWVLRHKPTCRGGRIKTRTGFISIFR